MGKYTPLELSEWGGNLWLETMTGNENLRELFRPFKLAQVSTDDRGRANFGSKYGNRELQVFLSDEVSDLDEIPVYHGVHSTEVWDSQFRAELFTKYFALHWFKGPYTGRWRFEQEQHKFDEDDSKPDRNPLTDWKNMDELARNGGLLTLRDTLYEPEDTKLMRITPVLPQAITPIPFEHTSDEETHYAKTIEIYTPASFVVSDVEYPELFDNIAPRQGSLKQWDKHVDIPRRVYRELLESR